MNPNEALEVSTVTANSNLDLLVKTVQELSLARDLETVMRIVKNAARKLTGADGATFVLRDGDLCFYADEDAISPLWKGSRFPMDTCISGWAMLNKKAAVIEDIYTDPRIPIDAYKPTFVKSLAMVPIRIMDPIGAIGNYWAQKHLPTPEELNILQSLADITAVTLENIKVYAELEQRVKDRTAQLEAANKELEAFSYSISHDLQAPLRRIDGYVNILIEEYAEKFDAEGKRLVHRVSGNVKNMSQLIEDMLAFFKTGTKEIERKAVVAVREIVANICANYKGPEVGAHVEFVIRELPSISGDEGLLTQVWVNLISNAVKYSSMKQNPVVEISSKENDTHIIYIVKDNGVGFNMKYYDKLFDIFQRLHSEQEFEGTGIGLSIVERIVTRHGGKVWAEAEEGVGATFYFSLPKS